MEGLEIVSTKEQNIDTIAEKVTSTLSLESLGENVNKLACAGAYIDNNNKIKVFIPEIKFSVYHGEQQLIPETTTIGFVNFEMDKLPPQANAEHGHATDSQGKYIFYTAQDGKRVKLYHNCDSIMPPESAAEYKIKWVSGTKKDGGFSPFGGGGSHSTRPNTIIDSLFEKNISPKSLPN